ncbi:MAG: L,D-transpeptidase family protein [Solirubrobacterales bacterium]|nr:L,D-transpeptidase family protein [Solirubrobacterales bacterium]
MVRTTVRSRPGGRRIWVARGWAKWSGGSQKLMVLGSRVADRRQWLKVRLPGRPNGRAGWLPRDRVALRRSPYYLVLDRSRRRLTVFRNGWRRARWRVVVGKRSTPTPLGLFATYDRVRQRNPDGFIGPWAMPLTAHSERLKRYDGGPGLIAFHGRDGASLYDPLGSARSHGCVRMNNKRIRQLVALPLGIAVRIRR